MDEAVPFPQIERLSEADRAYVASRARCLLWHAWVERVDGGFRWRLAYVDEDAAYRFLPVPRLEGESLAQAFFAARHPEDRERSDRIAAEAILAGRDYAQDYRCHLLDGSERWLHEEVSVEAVGTDRWRLVGAVGDVTEQKRNDDLFRQLAESIPQIAWIQRADGTMEYLNRRYFELTGEAVEVSNASGWASVVHPIDAERLRQTYRAGMAAQRGWIAEVRIRTPDGRYRWYQTQLVPLYDDRGHIFRWFGTASDIHAHKEVEEELERRVLERTRELVHAYDEMEAFNYSVSHDLRAPARAIHFACSVLLDEHADELSAAAKAELKRALDGASRMGRLIDDLLQYSRLHRRDTIRTRIDLSTIARLVLEDLGGPQHAEVEIQPGMTAEADAGLVRLIFQNLLENSLKFTRPVPNARIEVGAIGRVYFVRDNGVGFDPAYSAKLFQPFQRLHRAGEFPGTGIGLASVRRIVERHGGRVWAEGAPGKGATFSFTLD
jgi:PAS domain S-box-containing protein